jgi:hypothetical protein
MSYGFSDLVGNLGVFLILWSYLLLQIGRTHATSLAYVLMNFFGAAFILYSLIYDFNLSAFIIEIAWMVISLLGLARIFIARKRPATSKS